MTHEAKEYPVPDLVELLELEQLDVDLYRSVELYERPFGLYGGQVAAHALRAAGLTVPAERLPHSVHGYFLRRGDAARSTVLHVRRDRDGGSFSARRVIAVQEGEVIFNLSASFHRPEEDVEHQVHTLPQDVPSPEELDEGKTPWWPKSLEVRPAPSPYPNPRWPTRGWLRLNGPVPDDKLFHACVMTYLSDLFSGTSAVPGPREVVTASIDHVVWIHHPVRLDDWVLMDLHPVHVGGGRGLYTGSIFSRSGLHAATISQEALFRTAR